MARVSSSILLANMWPLRTLSRVSVLPRFYLKPRNAPWNPSLKHLKLKSLFSLKYSSLSNSHWRGHCPPRIQAGSLSASLDAPNPVPTQSGAFQPGPNLCVFTVSLNSSTIFLLAIALIALSVPRFQVLPYLVLMCSS